MDNKKALKQVGKAVGVSTAIGAGIGTAGAIANKVIKKKKGSADMTKEAFDLVNSTFDKVAGVKEVLTGKNIRGAINDVKGGSAVINNFKKNLKHIEPGARQATKEMIGVMGKDLNRIKGRVVKEGAKTVGAYAAPLAVGAIAAKKIHDKKKEKTASEIVNLAFEEMQK